MYSLKLSVSPKIPRSDSAIVPTEKLTSLEALKMAIDRSTPMSPPSVVLFFPPPPQERGHAAAGFPSAKTLGDVIEANRIALDLKLTPEMILGYPRADSDLLHPEERDLSSAEIARIVNMRAQALKDRHADMHKVVSDPPSAEMLALASNTVDDFFSRKLLEMSLRYLRSAPRGAALRYYAQTARAISRLSRALGGPVPTQTARVLALSNIVVAPPPLKTKRTEVDLSGPNYLLCEAERPATPPFLWASAQWVKEG